MKKFFSLSVIFSLILLSYVIYAQKSADVFTKGVEKRLNVKCWDISKMFYKFSFDRENIPEKVKVDGSLKINLETSSFGEFARMGFSFSKPLIIPEDQRVITVWLKGNGHSMSVMARFSAPGVKDKKSNITFANTASEDWALCRINIPENWKAPVKLKGFTIHNWNCRDIKVQSPIYLTRLMLDDSDTVKFPASNILNDFESDSEWSLDSWSKGAHKLSPELEFVSGDIPEELNGKSEGSWKLKLKLYGDGKHHFQSINPQKVMVSPNNPKKGYIWIKGDKNVPLLISSAYSGGKISFTVKGDKWKKYPVNVPDMEGGISLKNITVSNWPSKDAKGELSISFDRFSLGAPSWAKQPEISKVVLTHEGKSENLPLEGTWKYPWKKKSKKFKPFMFLQGPEDKLLISAKVPESTGDMKDIKLQMSLKTAMGKTIYKSSVPVTGSKVITFKIPSETMKWIWENEFGNLAVKLATVKDGEIGKSVSAVYQIPVRPYPALPAMEKDIKEKVEPFGELKLVDLIDCGKNKDEHPYFDGTRFVSPTIPKNFVTTATGLPCDNKKPVSEKYAKIEKILGRKARVLPCDDVRFFAYRIGRGKLQPGKGYVLVVEYPEDIPRKIKIFNGGDGSSKGFITGNAVPNNQAIYNFTQMKNYPLSKEWKKWKSFFVLLPYSPCFGSKLSNPDAQDLNAATRPPVDKDGNWIHTGPLAKSENGFWVFIFTPAKSHAVASNGAAVGKIKLYEVPDIQAEKALWPQAAEIPETLPKRTIMSREETMAANIESDNLGFNPSYGANFWDGHARKFKMLGLNGICRDFLHFNHCSYGYAYGNNDEPDHEKKDKFYVLPRKIYRSHEFLAAARKFDLKAYPFFEYGGSHLMNKFIQPVNEKGIYQKGQLFNEKFDVSKSSNKKLIKVFMELYGIEKNKFNPTEYYKKQGYKAGGHPFTAIGWERFHLDLTFPKAIIADTDVLLQRSIGRYFKETETYMKNLKEKEKYPDYSDVFGGVIFRHRLGMWSVGYRNSALKKFLDSENISAPANAKKGAALRKWIVENKKQEYEAWWRKKRAEVFNGITKLVKSYNPKMKFIWHNWHTEGAPFPPAGNVIISETPEKTARIAAEYGRNTKSVANIADLNLKNVLGKKVTDYLSLITGPEIADIAYWVPDPQLYPESLKNNSALISCPIHYPFTANKKNLFDAFRNKAGLLVAHCTSLNENDMGNARYQCADIEAAGPYCMLPFAKAFAKGDPENLIYLWSSVYARGFPVYVRNFHQAFLSLPAVKGKIIANSAENSGVVARVYESNEGIWVSVVNPGMTDIQTEITLPDGISEITDLTDDKKLNANGGKLQIKLYPAQLKAFKL